MIIVKDEKSWEGESESEIESDCASNEDIGGIYIVINTKQSQYGKWLLVKQLQWGI